MGEGFPAFIQGDMLVIHVVIDHLGQGVASQTLQCLNVRKGFSETTGLQAIGVYP